MIANHRPVAAALVLALGLGAAGELRAFGEPGELGEFDRFGPAAAAAEGAPASQAEPATAGTAATPVVAAWMPGAGDRVVRRSYVPDAADRHGEVRLLARGTAAVVQTVLYSKLLKRVVAEILSKERANWPPGGEGAADSERYTTALEDAAIDQWRRQMRFGDDHDRTQRLVIEFLQAPDVRMAALYQLPEDFHPAEAAVVAGSPIAVLGLSPSYVERNMILIAIDALGMSEADARAEIGRILSPDGGAGTPVPAATPPPRTSGSRTRPGQGDGPAGSAR